MRQHIVIPYKPREQFKAFHKRTQRYACIVAHRRAGKTVACIRDLERAALRNGREAPPPRYAYIAPLYSQGKDIAWTYLKAGARTLPGAIINESELTVTYGNGATCRIYGADNPDRLRGIYLDGVVLDEYADFKVEVYEAVILPQLMDFNGWVAFIGTSKGRDAFYDIWVKACAGPDDWFTLCLRASETGLIPEEKLVEARANMSEALYNQELECSFDEASIDQFISGLDVAAARARKSVPQGPRVMGVDVARFGDDRTVIVYRNGDVLDEYNVYRGLNTMEIVQRIAVGIESYGPDAVFIDVTGGLGSGPADRLRELRYPSIFDVHSSSSPLESGKYLNLRSEMWDKMRKWIKDRAQIPSREDLTNDLCSLTYKFNHRNLLQMEDKADLKKRGKPSPDIADALALTFAMPIASKEMRDLQRRNSIAADYDPLYRDGDAGKVRYSQSSRL